MTSARPGATKLLPTNHTPFEGRLAETSARVSDVPVPLDTLSQPTAVTGRFLPFVAWGLSVDVWPGAGDDTAHRAAVAASLPLHQRKGTPYALRRYVALTGAEVTKFRRPPATAHLGPSFTAADRAAWLTHYPELRIYPYRGKAKRKRSFFLRASFLTAKGAAQRGLLPSSAEDRAGRVATLYDRGVEVPLRVTVTTRLDESRIAIVEEQVHLLNLRPLTAFLGYEGRRRFLGGGAQSKTVRLTHSVAYAAATTGRKRLVVSPSQTPIDPTPVEVHGHTTAPRAKLFLGKGLGRFLGVNANPAPSTSYLRVYDTVWLYEPGRHVPPGRGRFFLSRTRLGQPPFTADVNVRITRPVTPRKAFVGPRQYLNRKHLLPADRSRLDEALRAIRSARSLRDQVYVDLDHHAILSPGPNLLCGDAVCGDQVEISR
ncbi:phage tail protein I [Methylobacterium nigriterrae]|uniref:phage tail protein I n=1 Tax=Methylobacterium nigriterrae TaxID=3127512 RepID=UPI003014175B